MGRTSPAYERAKRANRSRYFCDGYVGQGMPFKNVLVIFPVANPKDHSYHAEIGLARYLPCLQP